MSEKTAKLREVRTFWDSHPLYGYESQAKVGTKSFFDNHSQIRFNDVERFALHLYEFDKHRGERILDVGCGIGWLCEQFARGGAQVVGIDLSRVSVELTRTRLRIYELSGTVLEGNAEQLPFADSTFSFATAAGVLHHTPNTQLGIDEIWRVLRPGGRALITLYYRNWFMHRAIWPIVRFGVRWVFASLPGRSAFGQVKTVDDFVRIYDGNENPLGKAYSRDEVQQMFRNFDIERLEIHYFPKRFIPFAEIVPEWMHRLLNRWCGTMIYAHLKKTIKE